MLHNDIISPSVIVALPSFTLVYSPKINLSSAFFVASENNIFLSSLSSRNLTLNPLSPRWIFNPLFSRSVFLFQHLSSFIQEADIARIVLEDGYLISNNNLVLHLVGIIVLEWSDWFPVLAFNPLNSFWVWIVDLC